MDSFNQTSLYDTISRQSGTPSSLVNNASSASSRIVSPSISSSVLGRQGSVQAPQVWPSAPSSEPSGEPSEQPGAYPGFGVPLGFPNQQPAQLGQLGANAQYTGQMGNQFAGSQLGGNQFGSAAPLGAFGQLGNPYANPYGNPYANPLAGGAFGNPYGSGFPSFGSDYGLENASGADDGFGDGYGLAGRSTSVLGSRASSLNPVVPPEGPAGAGASGPNKMGPNGEDIVMPGSILWHYIDLQRQEQGPFNGLQMFEWIRYLDDSTLLRRQTDQLYVSFAVLKQALETDVPFIAQLTEKAWNERLQRAQEIEQAHEMERAQAGKSPETPPGAEKATESAPEVVSEKAPEVPQPVEQVSKPKPQPTVKPAAQPVAQPAAQPDSSKRAPAKKSLASTLEDLSVDETRRPASPASGAAAPKKVVTKETPSAEHRTEPAAAPPTDPWKKPARATQVKIADLKQQALDSQKKKAPEPASRKSSQGRWMPLQVGSDAPASAAGSAGVTAADTSAGASAPTTESVPAWNTKTVTPARSLADVQREQKEQAQREQKARSTASMVAAGPATAKGEETRTTSRVGAYEEPARPRQPASRSAAPAARAAAPAAKPAPVSPAKPRAARPLMSVTARANMASPADELVHWVRTSFKDLVRGVDGMELLDVFLSLGNTKSAKEFIAESIYEYSRSLDGRKFASDFLSRKKTAEDAMGTNETWKDVVARFNPNAVVETDPSFQVVSKKRTQKIARPGDGF